MKTKEKIANGIRYDLFSSIQYQTSDRPSRCGHGRGRYLGIPWVFKWIFQETWDQACANLALVDWSQKQCTKTLFDPEKWAKLSCGVQQACGRCLRYFADNGMLPIYVMNPTASGTKYYGLIVD
jgi:hypothetical protein